MFQNFWNKFQVLVYLSLLASLGAIYFALTKETNASIKLIQNIAGAYALLFPVGWLFMAVLFRKAEQISLLARVLLSIALSIAVNSISLMVIFYSGAVPLNAMLNVSLLLFFGTLFFGIWIALAWREKHAER